MPVFDGIKQATIKGDGKIIPDLVKGALHEGIKPDDLINYGFIAAMEIVGRDFAEAKIFIPEMLIAANAMKIGLTILKPHLADGRMKTIGKVVMGTVHGDLHDIGKNLVGMMMEGVGLEVIDIGINIPPEKFVEAIRIHQPQFVGMSALLTTTMPAMRDTIHALEEAEVRHSVKIIVGGAPITQEFADEIGADAFGANASEAVFRVKELLG